MKESGRTLVVFDFDGTLIKGDSFWPFLTFVAGWPRAIMALLDTLILYIVRRWKNKNDPAIADSRTFIKAELLQRLVGGRKTSTLAPATKKLCAWQKGNEPMQQALLEHHAAGHHIVIASGSLDLYLHELLKNTPVHKIICTEVGTTGGQVTGIMTSSNCVRSRKAELVAAYMAQQGPFDISWGYGNYPHDVPMLNLMKHRIIV